MFFSWLGIDPSKCNICLCFSNMCRDLQRSPVSRCFSALIKYTIEDVHPQWRQKAWSAADFCNILRRILKGLLSLSLVCWLGKMDKGVIKRIVICRRGIGFLNLWSLRMRPTSSHCSVSCGFRPCAVNWDNISCQLI